MKWSVTVLNKYTRVLSNSKVMQSWSCHLQIFNNSGGAQNAETPPEVAGDKDIQAQLWDYYDKLIQGRPTFKNSQPREIYLRK